MKKNVNSNKRKNSNDLYTCKVCNTRLSRKGDICTNCDNDLKKYKEKEYYKEDLLLSLNKEDIKNLSTKNNKYEVKEVGKNKELALVISYKYTYFKTAILQHFEIAILLFIIFLSSLYQYGQNNIYSTILVIFVYGVLAYLKNMFIKKAVESKKIYFYKDKVEKISKFPISKKQKILYVKIDDIKKTTSKFRTNQDLYIYEIEKESIIKKYIEIPRLENIDKISSIIAYITKFDGPEKYSPSLQESLKDSFSEIKKAITDKKTSNTSEDSDNNSNKSKTSRRNRRRKR